VSAADVGMASQRSPVKYKRRFRFK